MPYAHSLLQCLLVLASTLGACVQSTQPESHPRRMRIEIGEDVWEWTGGSAFEPGHYVIWQGTTLEVSAFCPEGEIEVVDQVSLRVDSAAGVGEHRFVAAAINMSCRAGALARKK